MTNQRKFYRSVIQIEILSETPFLWNSLEDVKISIERGECSGEIRQIIENQKINAQETAKLLIQQGSDPEFFCLTENGEDSI